MRCLERDRQLQLSNAIKVAYVGCRAVHLMSTLFVKLSVELFPGVVNGISETVL